MAEIKNRYGDYKKFCNTFSYSLMESVAHNPLRACGGTAPTLVRLDVTYGEGAAKTWLYDVLQATFMMLGVPEDRMCKEQIYDLAVTISSQYRTVKVTEVLLFLSRLKSGKYGTFYGDTSYYLVFTQAFDKFCNEERVEYLRQLHQQEVDKSIQETKQEAITYEEYKRRKALQC